MKKQVVFVFLFFSTIISFAQIKNLTWDELINSLKNPEQDIRNLETIIAIAKTYSQKSELDSANLYLHQARRLNQRLKNQYCQNTINVIAARIKSAKNPELDVRTLYLPTINYCKTTGDAKNEMDAIFNMLAKPVDKPELFPFWISSAQRALALSRKLKDKETELWIRKVMADIFVRQNELDIAEKEFLKIISDKDAPRILLIYTYDALTGVYSAKGKFDKALNYGFKTLRTIKTREDSLMVFTFYDRLRFIYIHLNNPAESNIWAKKAFENALITKDYDLALITRDNICNNLLKMGKPKEALAFVQKHNLLDKVIDTRAIASHYRQLGNCYLALKNDALAKKNYNILIDLMEQKGEKIFDIDKGPYLYSIGQFYSKYNEYAKAEKYLLLSLNNYKVGKNIPQIKNIYFLLFELKNKAGDYKNALKFLQEGNKLKDSIFNSEKSKQIEELQVAYDTEQKTKNIQQLSNTARIQQLNLEKANASRNWIIFGSFLILVIAGLLLRQAMLSKKTNVAISLKNEALQRLVDEKEWLLKEVHHRVKNNLHTVICLLESQAKYLEKDALKAIENSQNRIYTMSLIHQKLYQSENLTSIEMSEYIPELVNNLKISFGTNDNINFQIKIDQLLLSTAMAIPLGLIINEAVTNSIKYAFPDQQTGNVKILLTATINEAVLVISDDGVGLQDNPLYTEYNSLGIEMIKGLTTDINAKIKFESTLGTQITISFDPSNHEIS